MEITLYSFSKRINSTKQPTGGTSATVVLKEDTSIYTPSFILTGNLPSYNYLKWGGRYYFIEDIVSINRNTYEIMCNLDVLATYKSDILNTKAFVLYSTNVYNSGIPDTRLSTVKDRTVNTTTVATGFNTSGCYFVSFIGTNTNTHLVITSPAKFDELCSKLMDNGNALANFGSSTDYLNRRLTSCADSLIEAHYLPITPELGGSMNINLGAGYQTGISASSTDHDTSSTVSVSIPWNYSDFRNRSQYTTLLLYLPGYGVTQLNPDNFLGKSSISVKMHFDPYNGGLTYNIDNIIKCDTNVSVPINVGSMTSGNIGGMIGGAVTAGASLMAGNVLGATASAYNAIASSFQHSMGSVGSNGGSNSWNAGSNIVLTCISHNTSETPADMANTLGRPYNNVTTLSAISGYCECSNASVNTTAPGNIKDQINSYLNGGVYIE